MSAVDNNQFNNNPVQPLSKAEKAATFALVVAVAALIFIIITACMADLGQKFPFGVTFGNVSRYILYSLVGTVLLSFICCSCCSGTSPDRMRDVDHD